MNTKELHAAIAKKARKAAKSLLWEKATKIVTKLGKEETVRENDYTTVTYSLAVTINDEVLQIEKSSYRYGPDYLWVSVDRKRVLEVNERSEYAVAHLSELEKISITHPHTTDRKAPDYLEFTGYIEGGWEHLLDLGLITTVIQEAQGAQEKARRETRDREVAARPLTEKEKRAAKAFGL